MAGPSRVSSSRSGEPACTAPVQPLALAAAAGPAECCSIRAAATPASAVAVATPRIRPVERAAPRTAAAATANPVRAAAERAGASSYLTKPFSLHDLAGCVGALLPPVVSRAS